MGRQRRSPRERFEISFSKWPDDEHYVYRPRQLGRDEYGLWGTCEQGDPVWKDGSVAFSRPSDQLTLVPQAAWWSAIWYPADDKQFEVYVDIGTPASFDGRVARIVDLDLDVRRGRDGIVEVLDEEQFLMNCSLRSYPDWLVRKTRESVDDVVGLLSEPAEPFVARWQEWRHLSGAGG